MQGLDSIESMSEKGFEPQDEPPAQVSEVLQNVTLSDSESPEVIG